MTNGKCQLGPDNFCHESAACAVRFEIWAIAASLVLSLIQALVGILGRSEVLVAAGLYSFYQAFLCGRCVLSAGENDSRSAEPPDAHETLWFVSLIAGFIIALGAADILIFSLLRLPKGMRGLLVEPSPYALVAAAVSLLGNYLLFHYSTCIAHKSDSRHIAGLRRSFRSSMIFAGLAFAGVALGQWQPIADAVAAVIAAGLLVKPAASLCWRSSKRD